MAEKILVKLSRRYGNLNAGETGGFKPSVAKWLVRSFAGEYVDPPKAKGKPEPKPEQKKTE